MAAPYQTPDSDLHAKGMVSCKACTKEIHSSASICPNCGLSRRKSRYKSKITAALFAFFLGGFGAHRFYLGQWWGIFYLLFFWLWIPGLIAFIEFFYFLVCNSEKWDEKYNEGIPLGPGDKTSGALIAILIIIGGLFFIATIGILAAIALPAYQDYTVRTKVAEALIEVNPLKHDIETYFNKNGSFPSSNSDIGIEDTYNLSRLHEVIINSNGIVIGFRDNVRSFDSKTIVLNPVHKNGSIVWYCTGGSLPNRYRPSSCRKTNLPR